MDSTYLAKVVIHMDPISTVRRLTTSLSIAIRTLPRYSSFLCLSLSLVPHSFSLLYCRRLVYNCEIPLSVFEHSVVQVNKSQCAYHNRLNCVIAHFNFRNSECASIGGNETFLGTLSFKPSALSYFCFHVHWALTNGRTDLLVRLFICVVCENLGVA
jgi:hypothetical protein